MSRAPHPRAHWIDFRELRSRLDFGAVLQHYKVELKAKGNRATGPCPLQSHQGKRRSPSFSADLERGIWQCFGCKARGNALDFACLMEGYDPHNSHELREGALKVRDLFLATPRSTERPPSPVPPVKVPVNVLTNPPLDFELQTLDFAHPYLKDRGFTDETIRYFGLGFCNRGMLKHRIAIPLHDPGGKLVGYAGRLVDDNLVSDASPKYKLPGDRERDGTLLQFRKSLLLYNLHRLPRKVTDIIVVEGFPSVWWLHQEGYATTVALMGSACSDEQVKLIIDRVYVDGRVWVMTDGDDAGKRGASDLIVRVSPFRFVRWVILQNDEQPTDCISSELERLLSV